MKVDSFAIQNDASNKNFWSDAKGPWQLNYMLKMNYTNEWCKFKRLLLTEGSYK